MCTSFHQNGTSTSDNEQNEFRKIEERKNLLSLKLGILHARKTFTREYDQMWSGELVN